jgi:hypothetical protein
LKVCNNTGSIVSDFNFGYDICVFNDQNRATSLNFSYSLDNISFATLANLDYTSQQNSSGTSIITTSQSSNIDNLNINDGDCIYLRWESNDAGGSGFRDEIGLDNIYMSMQASAGCGAAPTNFTTTQLSPTSVKLDWDDTGADVYRIRYKAVGSPPPFGTKYRHTNSVVLSGLNPCTTYRYQIHAMCHTGERAGSAVQTFTTSGCRMAGYDTNNQINIYPNPVREKLNIHLTDFEEETVEVAVFDLSGKQLLAERAQLNGGNDFISFDASRWENGLYILRIHSSEKEVMKKFVVAK